MAYQFTLPGRVLLGENALKESEAVIKSLGRKALVVTGKIITKTGLLKPLIAYLDEWGISYEIFNDITGEPTEQMIEAGVQAFHKAGCDFLIAIGGGSPLDSAKAIAAMSVLSGELKDYMGKELQGKFPPMVLIPTTAGTGSEATKFTIITDTDENVKMLLRGEALLPELAVIDPAFTLTAPQSVTAATGMDALTHAVEAYTSRKGNTLTDLYALSAIKRIFSFLPRAYSNGNDVKAREEMAIAAFEAGVCINNASVTLVHGMSRPIGALFHVPHGISNAMLLKECLSFALEGCYEKFAQIARAIGAAQDKSADQEAAELFLEALTKLCGHCNIPTLAEYGIDKEEFLSLTEKMAQDAIVSGSPGNTIKEVKKEDILQIYHNLFK